MTMRTMCVELELTENVWKAILNAFECGASIKSLILMLTKNKVCVVKESPLALAQTHRREYEVFWK